MCSGQQLLFPSDRGLSLRHMKSNLQSRETTAKTPKMNPNEYNSRRVPDIDQPTANVGSHSARNKEADGWSVKDGTKVCGNVLWSHLKICFLLLAVFLFLYLPLLIKIIQLDAKLQQHELQKAWEEEKEGYKEFKNNPYIYVQDIVKTMQHDEAGNSRFKRRASRAGSKSMKCTNMTSCPWVKQVTDALAKSVHTEVKRRASRPYAHVIGTGLADDTSSTCVRSAHGRFRWKSHDDDGILSVTVSLPYKEVERSLEITVTGAYYVYTQITCNGKNDKTSTACGFETVLKPNQRAGDSSKHVVLMHSLVDQIHNGRRRVNSHVPRNSMYHGGVFSLEAGDQIYVKPDDSSLCPYAFLHHERKAFFGAFLIYSDNLNQ